MPIGGGNNLPSGSNGARGGAPTERNHDTFVQGDFARLKTTVSPSRIRSTVRPRVLSSVVIVEDRALTNSTVRQLADFALIKAMTPTEEREHEPPSSSILSLFNPGVTVESGPQSVTWWDLAFLKSLTNTRSDAFADTQRSEIRDHMIKEINSSGPAAVAQRLHKEGRPASRTPFIFDACSRVNYLVLFSVVFEAEFLIAAALFSPSFLMAAASFFDSFLTADALFSALFMMLAAVFSPAAVTFSAALLAFASTAAAWLSAGLFLLQAASATTAAAMIMVVPIFIRFPSVGVR